MKYLYSDLGQLDQGDTVIVTIEGDSMNVRVVDSLNYQRMHSGLDYRCHGGHATSSPIRLNVPSAGHWYVVLDRGGHAFRVRWNARVQRHQHVLTH